MHQVQSLPTLAASLVGRVQSAQELPGDRRRHAERHVMTASHSGAYQTGERLSFDVLHDDQELAARRHHIESSDHIRMTDSSGYARLVEEHRYEFVVLGVPSMQTFYGDSFRAPIGSDDAAVVDARHPAGCDFTPERVPSDSERLHLHRMSQASPHPRNLTDPRPGTR